MTEESRISQHDGKLSRVSGIVTISESHPHSSRLGQKSKRQIEHWLQAEALLLIDKKEREQQKKIRLKQIEVEYERKREVKSRQISQKLSSSEQKKRRNLVNVQKKLQNVSKRHSSVLSRVHDQQQREIEKLFDQRKTYQFNTARPSSKMSNLSRSSSQSRYKFSLPMQPKDDQIKKQMAQISLRLEKAKSTKNQRNLHFLNRIHNHNTSEIQKAQMKANLQLSDQISHFSKKIAEKTSHADKNKKRLDSSIEKKQEDKEKAYSEKLRIYQDNLRSLQNRKLQKLQELNKKFNQNPKQGKSWHDQKGQVYHRRFLDNISAIEQRKLSRADEIIDKHREIAKKNRIYRERKDSLIKAIKYNPTRN